MEHEDDLERDTPPAHEDWDAPLVLSAQQWLADAMGAWATGDYGKVSAAAPIAAEHLLKAALWFRNPVLLAPLDRNQEKSFLMLATDKTPDLSAPGLRTIGLTDAMSRASTVFGEALPLAGTRQKRLAESRGGALHVGSADAKEARRILADVVTLFQWLSKPLGISTGVLFGVNSDTAQSLTNQRKTDKQHEVERRKAAAHRTFNLLYQNVGPALFEEAVAERESETENAIASWLRHPSTAWLPYLPWKDTRTCPVCSKDGAMVGQLEVDTDVETEHDRDGGTTATAIHSFYLIPQYFFCNVCRLALLDPEELAYCDLPDGRYSLNDGEITDDMLEFAAEQNSSLDVDHWI